MGKLANPNFIAGVCRQALEEQVRATTGCGKDVVVRNAVQALMPLATSIARDQLYPSTIPKRVCLIRLSVTLEERIPASAVHAAVNRAGKQARRKKSREKRNGRDYRSRGGSRGIVLVASG